MPPAPSLLLRPQEATTREEDHGKEEESVPLGASDRDGGSTPPINEGQIHLLLFLWGVNFGRVGFVLDS